MTCNHLWETRSLKSLELCKETSMVNHDSWVVITKRGHVLYMNTCKDTVLKHIKGIMCLPIIH